MIPKDTLELLLSTAKKTIEPKKIPETESASSVTYLVGEKEILITKPTPSIGYQAETLHSFANLVNAETKRYSGSIPEAVVFYDECSLVGIINGGGHRDDRITMALTFSAFFEKAQFLAEHNQRQNLKDFVRMLRKDFSGIPGAIALREAVREIKFTSDGVAEAASTRGRESIARSIKNAVEEKHLSQIPETVTLEIPVWNNPGLRMRYDFRCLVEIDPDDQLFQLVPFPDEVGRVLEQAVLDLGLS